MKISKINFWSLISIFVVLISFAVSYVFLRKSGSDPFDAFLNSAAIAGFVGLFVQFILSILQTILEERGTKICFISQNDTFGKQILEGITKRANEEAGVSLTSHFVEGRGAEITNKIRNFVYNNRNKFDGYIIRPYNDDKQTKDMIRKFKNSNINHVIVDWYIDLDGEETPVTITSDFDIGGKKLGEEIVKYCHKLKKNPNLAVVDNTRNTPAGTRLKALTDVLRANEITVNNYINVSSFSRETKHIVDNAVKLYKANKLDIIFCGNDKTAFYLMKKLKTSESQLRNDLLFVGYDGVKFEDSYILDCYGYKYLTIDVKPQKQGEKAFDAILEKNKSKEEPKREVPSELVKGYDWNKRK